VSSILTSISHKNLENLDPGTVWYIQKVISQNVSKCHGSGTLHFSFHRDFPLNSLRLEKLYKYGYKRRFQIFSFKCGTLGLRTEPDPDVDSDIKLLANAGSGPVRIK
jgi:hypothetical protein